MTLRIPPRLPWLAAVLLVLFGPWTALGQTTSSSTCQLTDAMLASLDFSSLGSTCTGGSAVNCGSCFCAVGRILYSGLQDQGGKALLESGNKTEIQDFITACQTAIGMKMITEAGTDFDTLLALQSCSAGSIPSTCFSDLIPPSSSSASSNTSSPVASSSSSPSTTSTSPSTTSTSPSTTSTSPSTTSTSPSTTSNSPSTTAFSSPSSTPSSTVLSPPASLGLDSNNGNYYDDVPISAPAPVATPSSSLTTPHTTAGAAGGYYSPPTPVHVVYYPPPVISLHPPSPIVTPATIPAPAVVAPSTTTIQPESPAPAPTAAVEDTATPSPAVLNAAGSNAANPMLTVWLAAVASFLVLRRL